MGLAAAAVASAVVFDGGLPPLHAGALVLLLAGVLLLQRRGPAATA